MWNSAWRCSDVSKERRLGRGLDFLLGTLTAADTTTGATGTTMDALTSNEIDAPDMTSTVPPVTNTTMRSVVPERLPVDALEPNPFQPRIDFDPIELAQLAQSMTEHGLLQPLVVRQHDDRWQLVAGERRLRAAQLAGWQDVPVRIVIADDRQLAELAIVENLQRQDLTAVEKAAAFKRYMTTYRCSAETLATRLGLDRTTVTNFVRLLELPESIRQALQAGQLSAGHAKAMLALHSETDQLSVLEQIRKQNLSVRAVEMVVHGMLHRLGGASGDSTDVENAATAGKIQAETANTNACTASDGEVTSVKRPAVAKRKTRTPDDILRHLAELERQFASAIGAKVKLSQTSKGRGKLVISFASHEEFERLRHILCSDGNTTVLHSD